MNEYWSWVLMGVGVTGIYLTTRKLWIGFAIGLFAQVLWFVFGLVTEQYGFVVSSFVYGAVNLSGLRRWLREKENDCAETRTTEAPARGEDRR